MLALCEQSEMRHSTPAVTVYTKRVVSYFTRIMIDRNSRW